MQPCEKYSSDEVKSENSIHIKILNSSDSQEIFVFKMYSAFKIVHLISHDKCDCYLKQTHSSDGKGKILVTKKIYFFLAKLHIYFFASKFSHSKQWIFFAIFQLRVQNACTLPYGSGLIGDANYWDWWHSPMGAHCRNSVIKSAKYGTDSVFGLQFACELLGKCEIFTLIGICGRTKIAADSA